MAEPWLKLTSVCGWTSGSCPCRCSGLTSRAAMKSPAVPVWVTSSPLSFWFYFLKELFQVRSLLFESSPIKLSLISVRY